MKRYEASWLAGLFDGEGNIVKPRKTSERSLRISITNTNHELLEQVLVVTGTGSITNHRQPQERHAQCWNWQCHGDNARSLLRQMLPWLIVKREKAEQAIAQQRP